VRKLRIHCPVTASTLAALAAGDVVAIEHDPVAARLLGVIRGDSSLGDFDLYAGVVEIGLGLESFTPSVGATPTLGAAGQPTLAPTVVLTTYVAADIPQADLAPVLAKLIAAHPWEIPVIELHDPIDLVWPAPISPA
jgi:hypothetical protein